MTSGLFIVSLFILYILFITWLKHDLAPARVEKSTWKEKIHATKTVIAPIVVILSVLGSIFAGIATPTEAAAIGCLAVFPLRPRQRRGEPKICYRGHLHHHDRHGDDSLDHVRRRRFCHRLLRRRRGRFCARHSADLSVGPWGVFVITMVITFLLGCFLDPVGIILLVLPIFYPVIKSMGFDPVWYCGLFQVNLCLGYITPPFGYNLFYMKNLCPESPIRVIYQSIVPFVVIFVFAIIVMTFFPGIITWLPSVMVGNVSG